MTTHIPNITQFDATYKHAYQLIEAFFLLCYGDFIGAHLDKFCCYFKFWNVLNVGDTCKGPHVGVVGVEWKCGRVPHDVGELVSMYKNVQTFLFYV